MRAAVGAHTDDIAGVRWDFRLIENDVEQVAYSYFDSNIAATAFFCCKT